MRSLVTAIFFTTILAGCVTYAILPNPAQESSAIAFTQDLRQTTSTLMDKAIVALPNSGTDNGDYTRWAGGWCPRHERVNSEQDVEREISRYCQRVGGVVIDNAFCNSAANAEILFYARVTREGDCRQVANPVTVRIIEPKPGRTRSATYLAALHEVGYRTPSEIAQTAVEQKRQVQVEQERKERELPMLRTPGTRVCNRQQNGLTFIGFIEGSSGPKIHISVQEAYYTDLLGVKGLGRKADNYQPQMTWDLPENWYVCE